MTDKSKMLWALPNTGKELQLTDSTVVSRVTDENGKIKIEYFNVAWGEKELKKPKQVPNSPEFAGYANIGYIIFVDAPKEKKKSTDVNYTAKASGETKAANKSKEAKK